MWNAWCENASRTGAKMNESNNINNAVGLDDWQRWIDSRPSKDTGYLTLAIKGMIEDLLTLNQVREITTWSLGVERRKANAATGGSGWRPVVEAVVPDTWYMVRNGKGELPYPARLTDEGWIDAGGARYKTVYPTEFFRIGGEE